MTRSPRISWRAAAEQRGLYVALLAGIAALGLAAEFIAPPGADNAYLLYTAGRVLDGAKLYVDIVEINPPLIVAFNFPPVLLARLTGLSDLVVFRLGVGLLLMGSIFLAQPALRRICGGAAGRRALSLVLAFALFVLPAETFGEREHLMLALILPYLLTIVARVMGESIPVRYAHAVGILAGFGFALKPHFALVWIVLEVWFAVRNRKLVVRPEAGWVVALLVGYAAAVLLLTPEYLEVIRRFGSLYLSFFRASLLKTLLFGERSRLPLLAVLAFLALRHRCPNRDLLTGLALATLGLLAVATIQQKGWGYHFYPASAVGLVLLGSVAVTTERPLGSLPRRLYGAVAVGVMVAVMSSAVLVSAWRLADPRGPKVEPHPRYWELENLVRRRAQGRPILVLSWAMGSAWPLTYATGAKWSMRFPSLWTLWALYANQFGQLGPIQFHSPATESDAERFVREAVAQDIERFEPRLLIVFAAAPDSPESQVSRLDYLAYFGRDPRIASQLEYYRYLQTIGAHDVYVRATDPVGGGPIRPDRRRPTREATELAPARRSPVVDAVGMFQLMMFVLGSVAAFAAEGRGRVPGA